MTYQILADFVLVVHALFIVFVAAGGLLVLRWRRVAPWHLIALAWGASVVGLGLVCPLTPLENSLRHLAGQNTHDTGFIEHYIAMAIYPPGLTRTMQILLAAALVVANAFIYAVVYRRRRKRRVS